MSFFKKVAINTILQFGGKIISTILGLVTVGLMTRYLNTQGFGFYSTIVNYLTLFGVIIEFGLHITTLQMISENKHNKEVLIGNIFTLRLVSSILFFSLSVILIWFFPYPKIIKFGVMLAVWSFLFINLNQILIGILQYNLKMYLGALGEVLGRVLLVAFVAVGVWLDWGFYFIILAIVIGSFGNFVWNFYFAHKYIRLSFRFDFNLWKKVFYRAWPIGLSVFFYLICLKSDILILSLFQSQEEVGIYGASYRFLDVLTSLPAIFMGLVLPGLRNSWVENDKQRFKELFQQAFDFLMILVLPLMAGLFILAEPIVIFIAGENFIQSGFVLKILQLALFALFIGGGIYGYSIVALKKQKIMVWGYFFTAVLSLSLYFYFIPKYSYIGAAYVTVISEYVLGFLVFIVVYKTVKFLPNLKITLKAFVSTILMVVFLYIFKNWNLLFLIIFAGLVYFAGLFIFKALDKKMLKQFLLLK